MRARKYLFGASLILSCLWILVPQLQAQPNRSGKKSRPVIHQRPQHGQPDQTLRQDPAQLPAPSSQKIAPLELKPITLPVNGIALLRITVTGTEGSTVYECSSAIFEVQEDSFSLLVPLGSLYKKVGMDGAPIHLQDLLDDNLLRLSGKFLDRPVTTKGIVTTQSLALLQLGRLKRYIDLPLTFKIGRDGAFRLQTYYEDNFKPERQWASTDEKRFFDSKITIDLK